MVTHQTRLFVIGALSLACIAGEVYLMAQGRFGETESQVLGGLLAILIPAAVDAGAVERRRRDPTQPALLDDVLEPPKDSDRPSPPPAG